MLFLEVLIRVVIGSFWLYFSSQKWLDYSWVKGLLTTAAEANMLPLYGDFLRSIVAPNWEALTLMQTILEGVIGVLLLLGMFTKLSALLGIFLAVNLTMTFAPSSSDFSLVFWFYLLALIGNASIITNKSNLRIGVDRFLQHRIGKLNLLL